MFYLIRWNLALLVFGQILLALWQWIISSAPLAPVIFVNTILAVIFLSVHLCAILAYQFHTVAFFVLLYLPLDICAIYEGAQSNRSAVFSIPL